MATPYLASETPNLDYQQFRAACRKESAKQRKYLRQIKRMSDAEFERTFVSSLPGADNRTRDEIMEHHRKNIARLKSDLSDITAEQYAVIQETQIKENQKFAELADRGMRAINAAKKLTDFGFWVDGMAKINEMSSLPLDGDFSQILAMDVNLIQTVAELQDALMIVQKPFDCFKINMDICADNFSITKENLVNLIQISQTLHDMHEAGIVSGIT